MNERFVPENEQGVIVLFAMEAAQFGFTLNFITASAFPDALIEYQGRVYRTEFEFKSSSFLTHRHDPIECDLIVCWEHEWSDSPLPVISLSRPDWGKDCQIALSDGVGKAIYWRERATFYEKRCNEMEARLKSVSKSPNSKKARIAARQDEVARMVEQGLTDAEMRRKLGVSQDTLRRDKEAVLQPQLNGHAKNGEIAS